jgi:hypothetical protein
MNKRFYKLVATVLAFLILALPGALSAREKRGANLVITLKDGQQIKGELIAVKPDSLLLLHPAGKDESIGIADIATINIYKKRKPARGVLYGTLIGAAGAGLVGYAVAPKGIDEYPGIVAMILAADGVVLGGVVGLVTQL